MDPETPAAMISRGTTSAQHVVQVARSPGCPQAIVDAGTAAAGPLHHRPHGSATPSTWTGSVRAPCTASAW